LASFRVACSTEGNRVRTHRAGWTAFLAAATIAIAIVASSAFIRPSRTLSAADLAGDKLTAATPSPNLREVRHVRDRLNHYLATSFAAPTSVHRGELRGIRDELSRYLAHARRAPGDVNLAKLRRTRDQLTAYLRAA